MNDKFLENMKEILKDEYPAYIEALQNSSKRGFRINNLKGDATKLFSSMDLTHEKSPFAVNGYYTDAESGIGYTPEYMSGAFYMQEPSASSAVTILNPVPGMKVLDMCAAPGSKTTQIAEKMNNEGLLIANEFSRSRSQVLLENIERNGTANAIILNCDTSLLNEQYPEFFDMILCDAPCSGEGMLRKEEEASRQWSPELVHSCAQLQKEILDNAYYCLKKGGTLVYSTCTLNLEENENQVLAFLNSHPDMHMVDTDVTFGRHAFVSEKDIQKAIRIFPMDGGEGHFVAKMEKDGSSDSYSLSQLKSDVISKETLTLVNRILEKPYPYYFMKNGRLYGGVNPFYDTGKIHLLRNQVFIGEEKKGRFEFSHHFFMSSYSAFRNKIDLSDEEVVKYMHGEQIDRNVAKGWYAMCYHGYVLGGAKSDGKALKNKFPKSFRTR